LKAHNFKIQVPASTNGLPDSEEFTYVREAV
jgi:hypothetical protein